MFEKRSLTTSERRNAILSVLEEVKPSKEAPIKTRTDLFDLIFKERYPKDLDNQHEAKKEYDRVKVNFRKTFKPDIEYLNKTTDYFIKYDEQRHDNGKLMVTNIYIDAAPRRDTNPQFGDDLRTELNVSDVFAVAVLLLTNKYIPPEDLSRILNDGNKGGWLGLQAFIDSEKELIEFETINPIDLGTVKNPDYVKNIMEIIRAIAEKRKIKFRYYEFYCKDEEADGKSEISVRDKLNKDGTKDKIVSPYAILPSLGRLFLVCSEDGNNKRLSLRRVDLMKEITTLEDEKASPLSDIANKGSFDPEFPGTYLKERPHMWGGEAIDVRFECETDMADAVADWFGMDVNIEREGNIMTVSVSVVEEAMLCWVMQYGRYVKVLSPPSLKKKLRDAIDVMSKNHK